MPEKLCPQCNAPLIGRVDKKYCSHYCRSEANRLKQRMARLPTVTTNETLWRNREILRQLWNNRPTMIIRETLISTRFKIQHVTGLHITPQQKIYFLCYDFGFQACIVSRIRMALIVKIVASLKCDPWSVALTKNQSSHDPDNE